jgi:prevent-host-death family protein
MIRISATKLRTHLFDYLDKAAAGEIIIIHRNNREVARLTATQSGDWRKKMKLIPQLLVTPEELIKPLDDVWAEYQ